MIFTELLVSYFKPVLNGFILVFKVFRDHIGSWTILLQHLYQVICRLQMVTFIDDIIEVSIQKHNIF